MDLTTNLLSNLGSPLACVLCFFMLIAEHLGVDLLALQEQGLCLFEVALAFMHASNIVLAGDHNRIG